MYTDSRGIKYLIADMPLIMVFNTVIKYGKKDLAERGYEELVNRFDDAFTKLNIRELVNNYEKEEK